MPTFTLSGRTVSTCRMVVPSRRLIGQHGVCRYMEMHVSHACDMYRMSLSLLHGDYSESSSYMMSQLHKCAD